MDSGFETRLLYVSFMFLEESSEVAGNCIPAPSCVDVIWSDDSVRPACPHVTEVVLRVARETVILGGIVLEQVFLAEISCRSFEYEHVGDKIIQPRIDDFAQIFDGSGNHFFVVGLLAIPEFDFSLECKSRMLGDTCSEFCLASLSADWRKLAYCIAHLLQYPVDRYLGWGVLLIVFALGEKVVGEGWRAPPSYCVEHCERAEEVGFGLDSVYLRIACLRDLLKDKVAVVDYAVNAFIDNLESEVGRGDVVVSRLLVLVSGIREGSASRKVVIVERIEEQYLFDTVDASDVSSSPIHLVYTGDKSIGLLGCSILVVVFSRKNAFLLDIQILFT